MNIRRRSTDGGWRPHCWGWRRPWPGCGHGSGGSGDHGRRDGPGDRRRGGGRQDAPDRRHPQRHLARILEVHPRRGHQGRSRSWRRRARRSTSSGRAPKARATATGRSPSSRHFITQKVSGMVLAPLDKDALAPPVHDAAGHKIPVVIIDSSLNGNDYVSFCATDNEKGGELAGEQMAKLLGGKGNVLVLAYAQGSASTEAREKGFLDADQEVPRHHRPVEQPVRRPDHGNRPARPRRTCWPATARRSTACSPPTRPTRAGCASPSKTRACWARSSSSALTPPRTCVDALKAGELQGLVVQNPFKMGEIGVMTLVDCHPGQDGPQDRGHRRRPGHARNHRTTRSCKST